MTTREVSGVLMMFMGRSQVKTSFVGPLPRRLFFCQIVV
jgi:hypothetical protein